MFRTRMLVAAALTALAVGLAAPTAPAEASSRTKMARAINYVRSWSNRHHLSYSPGLSRSASRWARNLMRRNVLAHSSRALRRRQGEVIEWHVGARALVDKTVIEWWRSPGHRAVMLARRYRRVGAGRAVGYIGGRRSTIWVVRFAR